MMEKEIRERIEESCEISMLKNGRDYIRVEDVIKLVSANFIAKEKGIKVELMKEIAERMGEAVHNAWMEKRKREKGWHSPEECPTRRWGEVYCGNCHPRMRPYKDLPESEKELDRKYPSLFFQILSELDYMVIPKNQILESVEIDEEKVSECLDTFVYEIASRQEIALAIKEAGIIKVKEGKT